MKEEYVKKFLELTEEEKKAAKGIELNLISEELINKSRKISNVTGISILRNNRFINLPTHNHSSMELIYVYRGKLSINIHHKDFELIPGDIIVIKKYLKHTLKSSNENDLFLRLMIQDKTLAKIIAKIDSKDILKDFLENNFSDNINADYLVYRTEEDVIIRNIIDSFICLLVDNKTNSRITISLLQTLFESLQEMEERMLYPTSIISKDDEFKNRVIDEIKTNYMKLSLKDLSKKLGLTNEYLSRKINKVFGKNFSQVLLEERMVIAEEYIRNTKINITEIAGLVGYENKSFFYKEFKCLYGLTPMKYRQLFNV